MRGAIILSVLASLLAAWAWLMQPANLATDNNLHLELPLGRVAGPALVAIQPWMDERHYQNAKQLGHHLAGYLQAARDGGAMPEGSIVVFPEHIGTWLVAAKAPAQSFKTLNRNRAMAWLIASRPVHFTRAYFASDEDDRLAAALFRMQAPRMAADYTKVFSRLAQDFGVTIVAGSIVLPEPAVRAGLLSPGDGPLYNVSAVFHADGGIDPNLVRKVHPIPDEAGFTAAAPAKSLPVFETASGRMGVLICADSWHPDVYAVLRAQSTEIIAVPAFLQPTGVWESPWHGYTTGWPEDADRSDVLRLTEREAWMGYALAGRLGDAGARQGATAFLRGELWDLGSDGANILVKGNDARVAGRRDSASISAAPLAAAPPL